MKTKNIMALALLPMMGMLTACSSDNEQTAERVPINLTASTVTITTRAAADTTLNNGYMEAEQAVKVRIRNTGGTSDDWTDYAFTSKAGGTLKAPTPPPFYPLDNTNVDIVAYSPYEAGSTFVVQEDQSNNDNYMASDLLFASKSNQEKTTDAVPLQFEHKMAKVVVNAIASSATLLEIILTDFILLGAIWLCEKMLKIEYSKLVQYDRIELVKPERREELIEDLRQRLGLDIFKVDIGSIDLLRDMAIVRVYFHPQKGHTLDAIDMKLKLNRTDLTTTV